MRVRESRVNASRETCNIGNGSGKLPRAEVDRLFLKDQTVTNSGFENHMLFINCLPLHLEHERGHGQERTGAVWPCGSRT